MKYVLISLTLLISVLWVSQSFADTPIVYARCERTTANLDITADVTINGQVQTVTRTLKHFDVYDTLPDVSNFFGDFNAPCDLMYRDSVGVETVIYDCSTASTDASSCAALDPAVSFDGNKIAFSVFHGSLYPLKQQINAQVVSHDADSENLGWHTFPNKRLLTTGAHLHVYDLTTAQTTEFPFVSGTYDSGPTFISNERLAFTSTRDKHKVTHIWGTGNTRDGTRIWTVDIDGKNPDLASHHSLSQEQHPIMLKNGKIVYSSWQVLMGIPFRHTNGSPGGFMTLDNLFNIFAQNPDGSHNFPVYGQHSGSGIPSYFGATNKASHFIGQTSDERIWFADYYRNGSSGMGHIVGVMQEPEGQEGIGPHEANHHGDLFAPRDAIKFGSWTTSRDFTSLVMPDPSYTHPNYIDPLPFAGKAGHPSALPNNELMIAWGKGSCALVTSNEIYPHLGLPTPPSTAGSGGGAAINMLTSLNMDTPGCDTGVYRATVIPSAHPNDLEMIVDSKEWHEIMARAVVPYSAIYGVDRPAVIDDADKRTTHTELPKGTPFGLLGAASITDRETHPFDGIHFVGEHQFNLQGTDTIDYTDEDLCGIRMIGVVPNRGIQTYAEIDNVAGERLAILGEVSVRSNKDVNGNPIVDLSGNLDTSFLLRMPANTPYIMQGIDCDGRTLNTDQTWQSLRPGEQKTCGGCHIHSRESRINFGQSYAATNDYTIPVLGEGTVPLFDGIDANGEPVIRTETGYGMQVIFDRDIVPIFQSHCASCHGGATPAAGLPLDLTGTENNVLGTTWFQLVADRHQEMIPGANKFPTGVGSGYTFRRPQLTKYVRAFNSLGSLLYWKSANQRTDNKLDVDDAGDIDFGANHPTSITHEELGLLSRWIDLGAAGGPLELKDNSRPTLHVASTVVDNGGTKEITELRLGTVDLGSGINPATLSLSINGGANIAPSAQMHGITVVPLAAPISDPNTSIVATVQDVDGNVTDVDRTAGFFLQVSADPPPPGDTESPTITLDSPAEGATVSGTVTVQSTASDNVGVTQVNLLVNGVLSSSSTTSPFNIDWDTTQEVDGTHTLQTRAFDAAGNTANSSVVNVTTDNAVTGSSTVITSPQEGDTVSGVVNITTDSQGDIDHVRLYVDGSHTLNSNTAPYSFALDTTGYPDGVHELYSQIIDTSGNFAGNITKINVTFNNSVDTESPVINITNPIEGATVSGMVDVTVDVTDNVGVNQVDLLIDGVAVLPSSTADPYTIQWDTTLESEGSHTVQSRAIDEAGNEGLSTIINVTVQNETSLSIDAGPDASIDEGQTFSRVINMSGCDSTCDWNVDWGDGSTGAGTVNAGATEFTIERGFEDGPTNQSVTVSITDGVSDSVSGVFNLTVNNVVPVGTVDGSSESETGNEVTITVSATDPGQDTVTGYMVDWGDSTVNDLLNHTYTEAGNYVITASVIDEDGTHEIGTHSIIVTEPCSVTFINRASGLEMNTANCN